MWITEVLSKEGLRIGQYIVHCVRVGKHKTTYRVETLCRKCQQPYEPKEGDGGACEGCGKEGE